MRSIILFVIAILLPLGVSAQNYDEFLDAAKKHLQAGKTEKAISCYNIYKKMTKQSDVNFERLLQKSTINGETSGNDDAALNGATEEVLKLYKIAKQGDAYAQNDLGLCYYYGLGVERNYEEAIKWYRKSAEQGNAVAQYYLGNRYYNGKGVERNYEEAVKWYRKAAEQGNKYAQYNLGRCYANGLGVVRNEEKAKMWFAKASENGYVVPKDAL